MSAAGETDGFDLKWKDHLSEVFTILRTLRSNDAFSDITLICSDDKRDAPPKVFRAHKVILAACSSFFERVLSSVSPAVGDKAQALVMTDVRPTMLRLLLNFMYDGEVFVESDQLSSFMETAEKLEIRGLHADGGPGATTAQKGNSEKPGLAKKRPPSSLASDSNDSASTAQGTSKRTKTIRAIDYVTPEGGLGASSSVASTSSASRGLDTEPSTSYVTSENGESQGDGDGEDDDIIELKEEASAMNYDEVTGEDYEGEYAEGTEEWADDGTYQEGEGVDDLGDALDHPRVIPEGVSKTEVQAWPKHPHVWLGADEADPAARIYFCALCGYSSRYGSYPVVRHQKVHTGERPYACAECPRRFAQLTALKRHRVVHTGERRHACPACPKRFSQDSALKRHYSHFHGRSEST